MHGTLWNQQVGTLSIPAIEAYERGEQTSTVETYWKGFSYASSATPVARTWSYSRELIWSREDADVLSRLATLQNVEFLYTPCSAVGLNLLTPAASTGQAFGLYTRTAGVTRMAGGSVTLPYAAAMPAELAGRSLIVRSWHAGDSAVVHGNNPRADLRFLDVGGRAIGAVHTHGMNASSTVAMRDSQVVVPSGAAVMQIAIHGGFSLRSLSVFSPERGAGSELGESAVVVVSTSYRNHLRNRHYLGSLELQELKGR